MKVHTTVDTKASPAMVLAALTDFSEHRPEIWPALDRERYRVHEVGDGWADVTEGNRKPQLWARERYDWSQPGTVRWRASESNFCRPGSGITVRIGAGVEGGSHLDVDWERSPAGPRWWPLFALMRLMVGRTLRAEWTEALDAYAARR